MSPEEFRQDLIGETHARAEATRDFLRLSFVDVAGARLQLAEELDEFELCHFSGTGARGRRVEVDGYAFDDVDGSVALMIADWSGGPDAVALGQTEARRLFGMLRGFVEDSVSGLLQDRIEISSPASGLASDLQARRPTVVRFRFYLATDRFMSGRVRDWPEESIGGVPTEFHIWDAGRFHRAHESASGRDELEIDIERYVPGGLACLRAGGRSGEYEAYLLSMPGDVLAQLYDEYGSRLLEGNVRAFLSTRGKINRGIQITLKSEPHLFFAYNNGIAATAEFADTNVDPNGLFVTRLKEFQIVNGGQTTASLAFARRAGVALDDVHVQVKLSVLAPERAAQLIPNIARYANSQNKVSDADLTSNEAFHIRIQELSRRLSAPPRGGQQFGTRWFYERARGQYEQEQARLSRNAKAEYLLRNPKSQYFTKTDLAKYHNSWDGYPHLVSRGAQKNFLHFSERIGQLWEHEPLSFNEEYFRRTVAVALLFGEAERLVSSQPWYEGGYRAQVVTYTLAVLCRMLRSRFPGYELNLRTLWDRQSVPEPIRSAIVEVSKSVMSDLVAADPAVRNVTEWAKNIACWERIAALKPPAFTDLRQFMISLDADRSVRREAAAVQKVDTAISAVVGVISIPGSTWQSMLTWGLKESALTPSEQRLLELAARMPLKIPTDRQAAQLMALQQKLTKAGFRDAAAR